MADPDTDPSRSEDNRDGHDRRIIQDPSSRQRARELIARLRANRERLPSGF